MSDLDDNEAGGMNADMIAVFALLFTTVVFAFVGRYLFGTAGIAVGFPLGAVVGFAAGHLLSLPFRNEL